MRYKRLFVLVEGDDDERFFHRIMRSTLVEKYDSVNLWQHAQKGGRTVTRFLNGVKAMGADYIFVADINSAPCVTAKKQKLQDKVKNIDNHKVIVVIQEIESWYLAGLDKASSEKLEITHQSSTDKVTKEAFNSLIPKKLGSRIDFLVEVLKYFSIETAKQKNKSFKYFAEKHDCQAF